MNSKKTKRNIAFATPSLIFGGRERVLSKLINFFSEKEKIINKINLEIEKSFKHAKKARFPTPNYLKEHLYG